MKATEALNLSVEACANLLPDVIEDKIAEACSLGKFHVNFNKEAYELVFENKEILEALGYTVSAEPDFDSIEVKW